MSDPGDSKLTDESPSELRRWDDGNGDEVRTLSLTERYRRRSWATGDRRSYRRWGGWRGGGWEVKGDRRDQVADSKPGTSCSYWNTWRIVDENMREERGLWGTGGRRDDSSTPLFGWRGV